MTSFLHCRILLSFTKSARYSDASYHVLSDNFPLHSPFSTIMYNCLGQINTSDPIKIFQTSGQTIDLFIVFDLLYPFVQYRFSKLLRLYSTHNLMYSYVFQRDE